MVAENDNKDIQIQMNSKNEPYLVLSLKYSGSGLKVIENIKSGEIIEHNIIVIDSEGKEIGREPINFQAFEVRTTKTVVTVKNEDFLLSNTSEEFPIVGETKNADAAESKVEETKYYNDRIFTDSDLIPQAIHLNKVPTQGTYVSVYLELLYVAPFLDELCDEANGKCSNYKKEVFQKIKNRNQLELDRIKTILQSNHYKEKVDKKTNTKIVDKSDSNVKFQSLPATSTSNVINYNSSIEHCTNISECSSDMKATIQKINSKNNSFPFNSESTPRTVKEDKDSTNKKEEIEPFFDHSVTYDGNRLYYREWNLVSSPKYFKVLGTQDEDEEKEKPAESEIKEVIKDKNGGTDSVKRNPKKKEGY